MSANQIEPIGELQAGSLDSSVYPRDATDGRVLVFEVGKTSTTTYRCVPA